MKKVGKNSDRYRGDFPIDRIGERHGRLTVIYPGGRLSGNTKLLWICRCDCGNTKVVSETSIVGKTVSCGCARAVAKRINPIISGVKIGSLVPIDFEYRKNKHKFWLCECDCGNSVVVREDRLRNHKTTNCGCSRVYLGDLVRTHGLSNSRLENIYRNMIRRCYSKSNNRCFKNYGARGIMVCEEWLAPAPQGFLNFYNWALENGYSDELSIDRIDVNGNYEPENCRWATSQEQGRNRRNTFRICIDGKTLSLLDAYENFGNKQVTYTTVKSRIEFYGWDPLLALTTPSQRGKVNHV